MMSDTDSLIQGFAREAGTNRLKDARAFKRSLAFATVLSLAVSVAAVLSLVGTRPDFVSASEKLPFVFKVASMFALAIGSLFLGMRAALPGNGRLTTLALLPAVALLGFRAVTDGSGLSILGNSGVSPQVCVMTILAVSLPPLAILLFVMRGGAPTRPALTGAITGMLAGALGAGAYALACRNDAGSFVALWYPMAVGVTAALGALIGRRTLAW